MSVRGVIRLADWTIGPDRATDMPAPTRRIECTTCGRPSAPSPSQVVTDRWAIDHAARTGHRAFRELAAAFLRVSPAPGNPLRRKEGDR
ncbi:hypothetical protein [Streptomyces sp. TRM49041]|uniref:DUF7848 domain-containing protein n=1 Tax=Streptomyces sp. TRM49041 TaxID=2603216 RepID=UPI0011EC7667|nr:hypothetical protein [Streptomyces sp. TRM49041]